uniref:EamA domain-containing protein n=1 Tax=Biomphalaria glabrata TaxID=6526 RepID=A0A2C9M7K2_BIOGL
MPRPIIFEGLNTDLVRRHLWAVETNMSLPRYHVTESTNGHTPINADDAQESKTRWDWSNRQSKLVIGTFVSMIIAVTWVSFSQLVHNITEMPDIKAPFTITYIFMICPIIMFPAYLCFARLAKAEPAKAIFRECLNVYKGSDDFHKIPFLWKSLMFCLISALTTHTYIRAMYKLGAADCTALFAANHSFVYLLSWIVLFEKFIALRILAMIFSITGIVLFAYVDGFGSSAMFGVVSGVASSAGAAVYGVGLLSLLLLWPLWLLLYFLGSEQIDWSVLPWGTILPSAFLATVYWGTKECAIQLTYQFFIGLGLVLAIPICSVADKVWKEEEFPGMKIAALVLITIGVVLILLPENWQEYICKHVRSKPRDTEQQTIGNSTTLRGRLSRTSYM